MFKKYAYLLTFLWSLDAYAQLSSIQRQEMADINILGPYNPGFENGISKWTASAGTFTAQSATLADGSKTASFVASAGSQTLKSQTVTIPAGLYGSLCTGSVRYKTTSDDNFTLQVIDATPTVLYSRLLHSNSNFEEARLDFACPASGSLALRLSSSGSGTIYFDNAFLGFIPKARDDQEINLVVTPHDARNWYASGAGVTVATTSTSTDLPLGSVEGPGTAIKITPVSGTSDYARTRVIVPAALASTMLKASWHQRPLSGYASGDLKFDVYSNSASDCSGSFTRLALTTDSSSSVTSIPNATGKYTTYFTTDGSSVCYEVRFTRVAGTTALNITNFIFGPGIQPQGAVVGDPQSWTPTFVGLGTPTITEAKWTRIGTKMFGYVRATSGTATADVMTMTLPNSLTAQITTSGIVGEGWRDNASASTRKRVVLRAAASSNLLAFSNDDYTWDVSPISSSQVGSNLIGNTTVFTLQFIVEIAEWQGSGTVNLAQNNVEYAYTTGTWDADDSTTGYGPGGGSITGALSAARTKQITFQTPIQVTDQIELELSEDGTYWMPASSFANNAGNNFISTTWSAAASASTSSGFYITKGSTAYKANVIFMRYTWIANDDSPVGDWTNGWKFRLKKFTSGVPVGFGLVTDTSSGLMTNPSSLGDAAATMMGMKQYTTGVTYNNSTQITFSSTPAGWSVTHAYFIPYKVQDGSWRCRVNINASWTSTATPSVSINLEALSATQPAYASAATTAAYSYGFITRSGSQASTIEWRYGAAQTGGTWSADFVLNAKPTWAY